MCPYLERWSRWTLSSSCSQGSLWASYSKTGMHILLLPYRPIRVFFGIFATKKYNLSANLYLSMFKIVVRFHILFRNSRYYHYEKIDLLNKFRTWITYVTCGLFCIQWVKRRSTFLLILLAMFNLSLHNVQQWSCTYIKTRKPNTVFIRYSLFS